jgi:hypothetical protein
MRGIAAMYTPTSAQLAQPVSENITNNFYVNVMNVSRLEILTFFAKASFKMHSLK